MPEMVAALCVLVTLIFGVPFAADSVVTESRLTVDAFRRRTSYMSFTRSDLQDALPVIEQFSKVELLDGHARSAKIRFEK